MRSIFSFFIVMFLFCSCQKTTPNTAHSEIVNTGVTLTLSPESKQGKSSDFKSALREFSLLSFLHLTSKEVLITKISTSIPTKGADVAWTFFRVSLIDRRIEPTYYCVRADLSVVLPEESESELEKILLIFKEKMPSQIEGQADKLAKISMMLIRPTNSALIDEKRRTRLRRRIRDPRMTLPELTVNNDELNLSFWTQPTGRTSGYRHINIKLKEKNSFKSTIEIVKFRSEIYQ